jgi:hypothetical protein
MVIFQILIIIGFVLYITFSSINFMDNYSKEVKENFINQRNYNIKMAILILILLYLAGTFNLIF